MSAPLSLWLISLAFLAAAFGLLAVLIALRLLEGIRLGRRLHLADRHRYLIHRAMRADLPRGHLRLHVAPMRAFSKALAQDPGDTPGLLNVAYSYTRGDIARNFRRGRPRRRLRYMHVMAHFPARNVRGVLRRAMVRERDPRLRLAAAKALGDMGALPGLHRTLRLLRTEGAAFQRVLRSVLRRLPANRRPEVMRALAEARCPHVRLICVDVLGQSGDRSVIPSLIRASRDADLEVRAGAVRAIGRLGDLGGSRAVLAALADPAWEVRCQACFAAGRLRLVRALPALEMLLHDRNWWVRFRAAEALYGIGGDARAGLRDLAAQPNAAGRVAQAVLLERDAA